MFKIRQYKVVFSLLLKFGQLIWLFSNNLFVNYKSGPKSKKQVRKYCRKEEKLLKRSNFSSFPQFFNISLTSGVIFLCEMWLFELFPQFCKSNMSRYGCFEGFQRVPSTVFLILLRLKSLKMKVSTRQKMRKLL